jgi:hypothetical protein
MVIMGFVIGLFLFLEMGQNSINHIVYLRGKTYLNQEYKKYSLWMSRNKAELTKK